MHPDSSNRVNDVLVWKGPVEVGNSERRLKDRRKKLRCTVLKLEVDLEIASCTKAEMFFYWNFPHGKPPTAMEISKGCLEAAEDVIHVSWSCPHSLQVREERGAQLNLDVESEVGNHFYCEKAERGGILQHLWKYQCAWVFGRNSIVQKLFVEMLPWTENTYVYKSLWKYMVSGVT